MSTVMDTECQNESPMTTSAALPDAFDLDDFSMYLQETGMSESNRIACMRVIKKLVNGKGVTHRNKPQEAFLMGYKVTPSDDIEALRYRANVWLPCRKGVGCIDKGHGWALNHPLKKLVMYKEHLLHRSTATALMSLAAPSTFDGESAHPSVCVF